MVQFRWYNNQTKCGKLGVVSMSSNRILEILEDYLAWAQLDKQHHKRISEMEGTGQQFSSSTEPGHIGK